MNTQPFSEAGLSYLPNSGSQVSVKIEKITNRKKFTKLQLVQLRVKLKQLS